MYTEAETFLILKYGSMRKAYVVWAHRTPEQEAIFSLEERRAVIDYRDKLFTWRHR